MVGVAVGVVLIAVDFSADDGIVIVASLAIVPATELVTVTMSATIAHYPAAVH